MTPLGSVQARCVAHAAITSHELHQPDKRARQGRARQSQVFTKARLKGVPLQFADWQLSLCRLAAICHHLPRMQTWAMTSS